MSRNLCKIKCEFCDSEVKLTGPVHKATRKEVGAYYEELKDMDVADAECSVCEALYLAWISYVGRSKDPSYPFVDLSHRHSFNDEPSKRDYPKWKIEWRAVKTPWVGNGP